MNITTDSSTFMQTDEHVSQNASSASAAGVRFTINQHNITESLNGDLKPGKRESLEAMDEEMTNTYDEQQAGEPSLTTSSSKNTSTSVVRSCSHWKNGILADAAAATVTDSRRALSDEAGPPVVNWTRPTSHPGPSFTLGSGTPRATVPAQLLRQPESANTSAAFPGDSSQTLETTTPTPRSNFTGPGGPGRSGTYGWATYTQESPHPSTPPPANASVLYAFSDSYAIPHSAAANAPSFSTAHPPILSTGTKYSAVQGPAGARHQEVLGSQRGHAAAQSGSLAAAGIVAVVDHSLQRSDEEEHARRKRRWGAAAAVANENGNRARRGRRIDIRGEAVVECEERSDEDDKDAREADTESSYSDEDSYSYSYSYSGSGSEEDYEYYEEFYEEEVEEDEEDEEEPRIDLIDGSGHGYTLHDILYGTPKAGVNAKRDYNRDFSESVWSGTQGRTEPRNQRKHSARRSHSHHRHGSKENRSAVTPERVSRHRHNKNSDRAHRGTDGEDCANEHHAATGKNHKKSVYEHGEPYTEGTFKASRKAKARGHYGTKTDLDGFIEPKATESDSEESEARNEPVTSAAPDGEGTPFASYSSSSTDSEDASDDLASTLDSHTRRRHHEPLKEAKKKHRHNHHRSGAAARSLRDAEEEEGSAESNVSEVQNAAVAKKRSAKALKKASAAPASQDGLDPESNESDDSSDEEGKETARIAKSRAKNRGSVIDEEEPINASSRQRRTPSGAKGKRKGGDVKDDVKANKEKKKRGFFNLFSCRSNDTSGVKDKKGRDVRDTKDDAKKKKEKKKGFFRRIFGSSKAKKNQDVEEKQKVSPKRKKSADAKKNGLFSKRARSSTKTDDVGKEEDSKHHATPRSESPENPKSNNPQSSHKNQGIMDEEASSGTPTPRTPPINGKHRMTEAPLDSTWGATSPSKPEKHETELNIMVSINASHPPTPRPTPGGARQTRHTHTHKASTGAQSDAISLPASHSPSQVRPEDAKGMAKSSELKASTKAHTHRSHHRNKTRAPQKLRKKSRNVDGGRAGPRSTWDDVD
ncbi:hypothetical protein JKF63_05980 [Porcisia hertigi]|uniref:Uncharacterized protein n=1 Tax=Porcisia hertigi TaxID=2761500 RepID=A0A836IIV5_9TRYP|nr:hypothetical protein JKF63_05980 [Porcisia hertigi]